MIAIISIPLRRKWCTGLHSFSNIFVAAANISNIVYFSRGIWLYRRWQTNKAAATIFVHLESLLCHLGQHGRCNTVGFFSTAFTAGHHCWHWDHERQIHTPYIHNSMLIISQGLVGHGSPHYHPTTCPPGIGGEWITSLAWYHPLISILTANWHQVQKPHMCSTIDHHWRAHYI